jgi:glycosyltransferase involved in cell wall biosynthesis
MPGMKIAIVSSARKDPSSGVGGVAAHLSAAFRAIGHSCDVVSLESVFPNVEGVLNRLLFAVVLPFRFDLGSYDVLDIAAGDGLFAAIFLKMRRSKSPRPLLVARSHGLEHLVHEMLLEEARAGKVKLSWKYPFYNGGYRLWQIKKYLQSADLIFFLNAYDRDYALRNFNLDPLKVKIVDNGLPASFIDLPINLNNVMSPKAAVIGTFSKRKGYDYSIPALVELLQRHDQLRVGFFGTGTDDSNILDKFPARLRSRIEITARYEQPALPTLLEDYNILLVASLSEGHSLVVLEGMACGLALVATNVSGTAERLTDRENAILIAPRSVEGIVYGIEILLQDSELFQKLRRAGYELAQGFSWERIARTTIEYYHEAMAHNSREARE